MTTYELPPEPPVGSRVKDAEGNIWERIPSSDNRRWTRTNGEYAHSWSVVLTVVAPLTLIEPDPWPTAPLIVATFLGKRCVFGRTDVESYDSPTGGLEAWPESATLATLPPDTLTDVVPVTVVPTERVDYLSAAHASWVAGAIDDRTMIGYAIGLLESLDELGVDQ